MEPSDCEDGFSCQPGLQSSYGMAREPFELRSAAKTRRIACSTGLGPPMVLRHADSMKAATAWYGSSVWKETSWPCRTM